MKSHQATVDVHHAKLRMSATDGYRKHQGVKRGG